jgi:hypothetical protein
MFRRAQCSAIIVIAGFASLVVAAPPGWAAAEESFDQLVERVAGELGIGPADQANARSALEMFVEGRETFRFETFGDEVFWGDTLRLHDAIKGERLGGVGPGLSPNAALELGLKVDLGALPDDLVHALEVRQVDLDDPATTLALLELNAVVGVKGFFADAGNLSSVGLQCAFCHSTVDDSFAQGIGRRLDGWANRDLDVGAIIALAPDLGSFVSLLGVGEATVRTVLRSWGPGKFDAELILDGKAFRPDGKPAATLLPPAFGLAGVNLHTWTGWGSVTHWNAFVANLEMGGQGTFHDPRLNDAEQFPIAAREGFGDLRSDPDLMTSKRAARNCSTARHVAPVVTCRRSKPSRAGTCTRPRRSGSTASRPTARLSELTGRRRSRVCGRIPRVVSTTTDDFAPCVRSSTTTIGPSGSVSGEGQSATSPSS